MKKEIMVATFLVSIFLLSFASATTTITDNEVTTTGNVTGSYIFGDGSQLTNLPSGGNTINGTRLTIANITNFDYNYNASDGSYNLTYHNYVTSNSTNSSNYWDDMNTINTTQMEDNGGVLNILPSWLTSFIQVLLDVASTNLQSNITSYSNALATNISDVNSSLDTKINSLNGNASWNESYADTLYSSIDYGYNETVYLETEYSKWWYNQTSAVNINFLQEILNATGIYSTYNATYNKWAYNMTDGVGSGNASWNQSLADTLYSSIDYNYNQTLGTISFIDTASNNLQSNISDVNSSLDAKIEALDTSGNASWNESYATTLYAIIDWSYNQTSATFPFISTASTNLQSNISDVNSSLDTKINELPLGGTINGTTLSIDNITNFNYNYNQSDGSYNITYETGSNSSWNESYATTLYAIIDWSYNQTLGSIVFIDLASTNLQSNISDVNSSLDTKINSLSGNASWNQSLADTLYASIDYNYNQSDGSYNSTYEQFAYNESTFLINTYGDFWYNMSDGNDAGVINGTILSINNITNFDYNYNQSSPYDDFNYNMSHPSGTNFAVGGNLTLGETITFALGEIIDNIVDGFIRFTGNIDANNNGIVNLTSVNFTNGGYIRDNGTALILGHN